MDPIEVIAWLSSELAKAQAEVARLKRATAAAAADAAGLDLEADPDLGHPAGTYPRRRREVVDLQELDDPMAPEAEGVLTQLKASDKFLDQPKQVRETIRTLVSAYPRYVRIEHFAGKVHMRERDEVPSRVHMGVLISKVRRVFGHDSIENSRGDGWRAAEKLLEIFDKKRDVEAEADVDLETR